MRLNLKNAFVVVFFLLSLGSFAQQISINDSFTVQQLVQNNLVQGCVEVSNINSAINGNVNGFSSFGYFENANSNFPFANGIMLSTGNANSAGNTLNTNPLNEGTPTWATDPDLEAALGINNTLNATSIQFDFISTSSTIQFNYILASEEYFAEFPCLYSDGFAFLIREAGSGNPYQNIAVIPGTNIPVNTNTLHDEIIGFCPAENDSFFEGYNLGDTNFNGRTKVLTATASITPNTQYNIKLIIADQTDRNFDSAVFIEGNSFTDSVNLGVDITTCDASVTLDATTDNSQAIYTWFLNDIEISGQNNSTLFVDTEGTYTVQITVPLNNDTCTFEDSVNVALNTIQNGPSPSNIEVCDDASNNGQELFDLSTQTNQIIALLPSATYDITYHASQNEAENDQNPLNNNVTSTTSNLPIFYNAQDTTTGCIYIATFNLIINEFPIITNPTPLTVCSNGDATVNLNEANDEITGGNENYLVTYHFNQTDADSGANAISSPYSPTNTTETIFVSILNITTGCSTTSTIDITVNSNPNINQDQQVLDACEQDGDGFDTFDLTQNIDDVLQGLTNVTVTYHLTLEDANLGINPITDPTNFANTVQDVQVVFVRVEDNTTGCASVSSLELHTFLLETGTQINDYFECDDASNDGIADFDLEEIGIQIINNLEDVTIEFYETETDQLNQTNPIDQTSLYEVTNTPHLLYIALSSLTCNYNSEINLIINNGIEIQALTTQDYCDNDDDGFTSIQLATFDNYVATGIDNATVSYHETETDAIAGTNSLPPFYDNTSNPLTVYVNVKNSEGCDATSALTIQVLPAPTITTPNDILICDNDQDGFSIIDLTTTINQIVTVTTDRAFSFHTTQLDAETNNYPITNQTNYNADTQMVFCRVENTITGCYAVQPIVIYVNTLPDFDTITTLISCETDGNQIGEFLFIEKDTEILNGQIDKEVLYFTSQANADANTNAIDKNNIFENTTSPQTIYVRVLNFTDANCYGTSSFQIEVGSNPIYDAPTDVFSCDDVSNDGFETFDLNEITTTITQNSPETLTVTYHLTIEDAEAQTNALPTTFTNTVNPQQIFATIDNGTFCKGIASFEFNIIQIPETNTANALQVCDDNTDGFALFDLSISEFDVLSIRQDNTVIEYYTSSVDLTLSNNAIANPYSFANTSNPQIVYIKVLNTISNCYAEIPLELIVEVPPIITPNVVVNICDDSTFIYDLNEALPNLIDTTQTTETVFYATQNDAALQQNPLDTNYTYTLGSNTIFVRANYPGSSCFSIESFILQANTLPVANTIQDLQICDDDFDGLQVFDLSQQTTTVLGAQSGSDFTVSYFTSQDDATNNENALTDLIVISETERTYFIRITNNTTGCFTTTNFDTIVNNKPELDIPDQVLCLDNLPLLVSAETNIATDTYSWSTNSTNSYIEVTEVGTYSITVTTQFGCTNTSTFTVSESEAATIEFTETVDFSDPNNITIQVSGIGDYLYQFNDEEPQESNFFYNVPIGPHIITVIDLNGCNSVSKEVVIIDVPQFVTPNGDGYFDTWHITGVAQLPGTLVYIFDRYGKLLKTLSHTSQGWDGKYNGHLMPGNDYWFVADVKKDTVQFQVKGHFALKY